MKALSNRNALAFVALLLPSLASANLAPPAPPAMPMDPPLHPGVAWISIDERYAWMRVLLLIAFCCCGTPLACCCFAVRKMAAPQNKRFPADTHRALAAGERLTKDAVTNIYDKLPETWKNESAKSSDAARDMIVHCDMTKRQFVPKVDVAWELMRTVPALWILDSNSDSGYLHKSPDKNNLAYLFGTSTPQRSMKVRTFMSHAWRADPHETVRALNGGDVAACELANCCATLGIVGRE